ncbi:hypothetical protein T4D_7660, partial [Trichinella pseudospiralis]
MVVDKLVSQLSSVVCALFCVRSSKRCTQQFKLLERCQEAQDAMEAVITDDNEVEKETQKWMDFESEIRSARGRAERYLEMNTEPADSKKSSPNSASAKLPTWCIPKFTGKVLDFPSFWEQFNAGIHDNAELAN